MTLLIYSLQGAYKATRCTYFASKAEAKVLHCKNRLAKVSTNGAIISADKSGSASISTKFHGCITLSFHFVIKTQFMFS